ncbi:MAG: hypothetical protein JNK52_12485 [Zoogloeaceae bacterium]|nr:hypothetical protein [Zoogloeaceae bacterium]
MHPGVLILAWMIAVGLLQTLASLHLLVVITVLAVAVWVYAPERAWRLVRRVRFLLLAIVVFFAGFTPGEALLTDFPSLSPSREGLVLAFDHAARLVAVVLGVAILLQRLSPEALIAGFLALLGPFQRLGFPAERVAVRTLLVLEFVESSAPRQWQSWVHDRDDEVPEPIRIMDVPFGLGDRVVLLAILGFAVLAVILVIRG